HLMLLMKRKAPLTKMLACGAGSSLSPNRLREHYPAFTGLKQARNSDRVSSPTTLRPTELAR
ncbi:MAG: hypothetical protein V3U32_03280, partial [Anaerolineales bacterium]